MNMEMPVMPMMAGTGNEGIGGFGQGGGWIVFLIIAMMFGWGRNGIGANGVGEANAISEQFALQDLKNGINGINAGLVNTNNGICNLGYENATLSAQTRDLVNQTAFGTERAITALGSQMASCCCETNRNIDAVRYENAKNTCDIITAGNMNTRDLLEAGNANTQRIVDIMTNNLIQDLRDKNQALTLSATLQNQTANILSVTNPRSIPAYTVCSPYEALAHNANGCF